MDLSKGILWPLADTVDPDQMPQNARSDQDHHYLLNVNVQKKSDTT